MNLAVIGTMIAASVHAALAVAVEPAGELAGFEALGVLPPQAARTSTLSAIAVRASVKPLGFGLIGLTLRLRGGPDPSRAGRSAPRPWLRRPS